MDEEDKLAARILFEMANGVSHETAVIPDSDKLKKEKCGNSGLKIRLRLPRTSSAEKKPKEELKTHGLGDRSSCLTGEPLQVIDEAIVDREHKSTKKRKCNQGGFSFSVIHLLSAVRTALLSGHDKQNDHPSFTIHEILESVRSRPGDPRILESKEPLVDLIRECLKRLSSKTAPVEAINWVPLVQFNKTSRSWSWIGPVPVILANDEGNEVETSSKSWGIPREDLDKLVKCFSDWLENSQAILLEIESLPRPPRILMEPINTIERFKDIRPLKSFCTIQQSSVHVRDYFHREEAIRYKFPERAFSYTALDGRKSMVAPLVKSCSKPCTKAREHCMLKDNRPSSFTVLSLVRDASARLPEWTGTRSDICVLVRDSQHIQEDVSDLQITGVVSGALDRLQSESDPCVKFDRERHLWTYLHGDREDEDFEHEDNAPAKRKKQNKEEN